MQKAFLFFGKPGAGKGTQADRMADKFNLVHFDTGKEIEHTVHDPKLQSDPVIQKERELFDSGILATPEWVQGLIEKRINEISSEGRGLIFSGSPRTLHEVRHIAPVLERAYGEENISVFVLHVEDQTSIFRNSHRRVCKNCRRPVVWSKATEGQEKCVHCGGELVRRSLDTPEIIKERLKEYRERTEPVIEFFRKRGETVYDIDGEGSPDEVTKRVLSKLGQ